MNNPLYNINNKNYKNYILKRNRWKYGIKKK